MKIFRALLLGVLMVLLSLPFGQQATAQTSQTEVCPGAKVSSDMPLVVKEYTQQAFDCFSWQSLVALNWAAGKNGEPDPDPKIKFGDKGPRGLVVWQTTKSSADVFKSDGSDPCKGLSIEECWNADPNPNEQLYMTSKAGGFLDGQVQAVPNAWLTDQNGNLVRYEIRLNKDEFVYILGKELYNKQGQKAFNRDVKLPESDPKLGRVGAYELKAAWKILTDKDDPKEYFTTVAEIQDTRINPENGYPDPKGGKYMTCDKPGEGPLCQRPVGLVGFHIAHKVNGLPQWVWSTFEHIKNVPIDGHPDPDITYSFFNPICEGTRCIPNTNPRTLGLDVRTPNQVTRVDTKILDKTKAVNDRWHNLEGIKDTVWENYELISTQWPTDINGSDFSYDYSRLIDGKPTPRQLANTTMETYVQTPDYTTLTKSGSSCIGCHIYSATYAGKDADFSYLFIKAKEHLIQGNN